EALAQARAAEEAKRAQQERAEANFRLARRAVDEHTSRVVEDLLQRPDNTKLRRTLLEEALRFYEQARQESQKQAQAPPDDPKYRRDLATTLAHLGRLLAEQGKGAEAMRNFEQAQALLEGLVQKHPGVPAYRRLLADVLQHKGDLLQKQG